MRGTTRASPSVRYGEPAGRWVLLAAVLGSALAFIDATVVNVALPRIGQDLGSDAAGLQWAVNGYTLSLASFILLGGSLSDRFGRRRVFVVGVSWFAAASLLCGLSPTMGVLIASRVAQGIGGALLTPGALAIIETSFDARDRARAIGAWSGLGGVAGAAGPLVGGWLVQAATWRLVFLVNLPIAALVIAVALRHVPETRAAGAPRRLDLAGALAAALGLAGLTYAFTAWTSLGVGSAAVRAALAAGVVATAAFVLQERRTADPMLPLELFRDRVFAAVNLVTFAVYAALGGLFFFLVLTLQVVAGFTPLAAGTALLPVTFLMLLLSARAGALAEHIGPRLPMSAGPVVSAGGVLLLARIGPGGSYTHDVLPGLLALGLGLSLTVAPLTATALGAVEERHAGIASSVNNAVARVAGLFAVATLPLVAGLRGGTLTDPATLAPTYRAAMLLCGGALLAGAALSAATMPSRRPGRGARARRGVTAPSTGPAEHRGNGSDGPGEDAIALRGVVKRIGGQTVGPIDLTVERGETVALVGESGAGKSTLLRIILGLASPDAGEVRVRGEPLRAGDPFRRSIGYVVQGGALFPHLTGAGNASLVARHLGWDAARIADRLRQLGALVGLSGDVLARYPREISGGQAQRVALVRALFLDPEILLLDEPLGALDPLTRAVLQDDLRRVFDDLGKTVVLVTHDLAEAALLARRLVVLRDGAVVQVGTMDDLARRPADDFVARFVHAHRTLHLPDEASPWPH